MCSKECCGAPVNECSCDSSCKKCNCYNLKEDGVIVPGVNTTVDVKPGETERQAAKFFGYNKKLLKKRNAKDPIHTLYNLGLVNESHDIVWERVVKQSDPLIVLDKVSSRQDNSAFPVRMYDGSTIGVTPKTAKRIIDVYDNLEDDKKKKVEWFLRTKNGFKELAQLVMGGSPTTAKTSSALQDHVEKAYEQGSTQRLRVQPHMTGLENPYQKPNKKELKVFTPAYKKMYDQARAAQDKADKTGGPGASYDAPVMKVKFSPEVLPPRTTPKKPRT